MAAASQLLRALETTHHPARLERMAALGRDASQRATVDELAAGEPYERRLALASVFGSRDGKRVLAGLSDVSRTVRGLAMRLVAVVCDDAEAREALRIGWTTCVDTFLMRQLVRRGRREVIDAHLDWLAQKPGLADFADAVPFGSAKGVAAHLARALERPSHEFWRRLAQHHPDVLGRVLLERWRAVPDEADPVTRQLTDQHLHTIARRAVDVAAELVRLLLERGIGADVATYRQLARLRPRVALQLAQELGAEIPLGAFDRGVKELPEDLLEAIAAWDPRLFGDPKGIAKRLGASARRAVARGLAVSFAQHPGFAGPFLADVDAGARDAMYERWSIAARDADGVVALDRVRRLPADLAEREGHRHLRDVVALDTRPAERIAYAAFVSWDDAEKALAAHAGHPDGERRGVALATLLAIPGKRTNEPELVDRALALAHARKNEQDPVRLAMLAAIAAWPRSVFRKEHFPRVMELVRDALDAGDLSAATAQTAERLLLRTFRLDPAEGARWLGVLVKERGGLSSMRLGDHLDDDELRLAEPHLVAIARAWMVREREHSLAELGESLGKRLHVVPALADVLEKARDAAVFGYTALRLTWVFVKHDRARHERTLVATLQRFLDRRFLDEIIALAERHERDGKQQPPLDEPLAETLVELVAGARLSIWQEVRALTALAKRGRAVLDRHLARLLSSDQSLIVVGAVLDHVHRRRQELLDPYLGEQVITGRHATGKTRWLLPLSSGFFRWTPRQTSQFAAALGTVCQDQERDTPTIWRCTDALVAVPWPELDELRVLASDARPAVQEHAIRVMARADRGQCVETLVGCLADDRARIAIYGLRRAILTMPPPAALRVLEGAPLRKVTVAKEILRLLGVIRAPGAAELLFTMHERQLHRDVRIALLRALWDHLEDERTWAIFEQAVAAPDHVLASRVGDIPANRLTDRTDRRLSALLVRVLARPEPEARIDLLERAATLSVRDPDRVLLRAAAARLVSPYDDEVRAAARALAHRAPEDDLPLATELFRTVAEDPRALHVAAAALIAEAARPRRVTSLLLSALADVVASDPRYRPLRLRCLANARDPDGMLAQLEVSFGSSSTFDPDAFVACAAWVQSLPLDRLEDVRKKLAASASPALRRLAVTALARDAGPERGWTPERRERLQTLANDPSPVVAGAARATFPPREREAKPVE